MRILLVGLLAATVMGSGCERHARSEERSDGPADAWVLFDDAEHWTGSVDARDVERLSRLARPPALWARHEGHEWLVHDPALVLRAQRLLIPMRELSRQQSDLGERMARLGHQQTALGKRQSQVGDELARLDPSADEDQARIDALDEEMDRLSEQMETLGDQMEQLGDEMEERGQRVGAASRGMAQRVARLVDEARAGGRAEELR